MNQNTIPSWLTEQTLILEILHHFVNRLDKRRKNHQSHGDQQLSLIISDKKFPGLFSIPEEEAQLIWRLIIRLADTYGLWALKQGRVSISDFPYQKARLIFQYNKEGLVRLWLNRPVEQSYGEQWRQAVEDKSQCFPGSVEKLSAYSIKVNGISIERILQGFANINDYKGKRIYLRQLSANCFWGDSKFLDGKDILIESLYPGFVSGLLIRPIMVHAYVPENVKAVLFIENQDSYTYCLHKSSFSPADYALVYLSGFKLTAQRIRETGAVSFHYGVGSSVKACSEFEKWWLNKADTEWDSFFWGDLDFSGMAILAGLKRLFPKLQCWQQAYQLMLKHMEKGHKAESAGKTCQEDPGITGCEYADKILLPALRFSQYFVDQEMIY